MNVSSSSTLFVPHLDALRTKFRAADGTLGRYWAHLRWVAEQHTGHAVPPLYLRCSPLHFLLPGQQPQSGVYGYPEYAALAYLVDGDPELPRRALPALLGLADGLNERRADEERRPLLFKHGHCFLPQLAFAAVYIDWMRDSDALDLQAYASFGEEVIAFAEMYLARARHNHPFGGGQQASAHVSVLAIGLIYGYLRGRDPRARSMVAQVLDAFPESVGGFLPGGYQSEGPVYQNTIASAGLVLLCALLEQITGEDVFFKTYPPNNVSACDVLRANALQLSPDGLMLPWNNYGFASSQTFMTWIYLAAKTGERRYLDAVADHWGRNRQRMWLHDEKVWCMLFWPEAMKTLDCGGRSDAYPFDVIPEVGCSMPDARRRLRVFQMWNECGPPGAGCIRAHAHPNALALEAYGTPLLLDGSPLSDCSEFQDDVYFDVSAASQLQSSELIARTDTKRRVGARGFAQGTLDAHNVVLLGRDRGITPAQGPVHGTLTAAFDSPLFSAVQADVTDFYRPTFDVQRVCRTTYRLPSGAVIVRDDIAADPLPTWRTRFWVRPDTVVDHNRAVVDTPEAVRLTLQTLDQVAWTGQRVTNFIAGFERDACKLDAWHTGERAMTLLYAQSRQAEPIDVTQKWRLWVGDADLESWHAVMEGDPLAPDISANGHWRLHGVTTPGTLGVYQRSVTAPAGWASRRVYVKLGKTGLPFGVWLDGQRADISHLDHRGGHEEVDRGGGMVAPVIEVTALIRPGTAQVLTLAVVSEGDTALQGACELFVLDETLPEPTAEEIEPDRVRVTCGEACEELLCREAPGPLRVVGAYRTDAQWAAAGADGFAGRRLTRAEGPDGLRLMSDSPVSAAWDGRELRLFDFASPLALVFEHRNATLTMTYTGSVHFFTHDLTHPMTVHLTLPEQQVPLVVQDTCIGVVPRDGLIALAPTPCRADDGDDDWLPRLRQGAYAERCAAAVALGARGDARAVGPLCEVLADADPDLWALRAAAMISLGRLGDRRATAAIVGRIDAMIADPPAFRSSGRLSRYLNEIVEALAGLTQLADPAALPLLERMIHSFPERPDLACMQWDIRLAREVTRNGLAHLPPWYRHVQYPEAALRALSWDGGTPKRAD